MKNFKNQTSKSIILFLMIAATQLACKKEESANMENIEVQTKVNTTNKNAIEIAILKTFMAKILNVDDTKIGYDAKTEQFTLLGVNQISRNELTEIYFINTTHINIKN